MCSIISIFKTNIDFDLVSRTMIRKGKSSECCFDFWKTKTERSKIWQFDGEFNLFKLSHLLSALKF